jgi:Na+(H+)/acetate symporter ActP
MLALIDPYILAFSAVTVVVTVFMGFWAARRSKSASDFFVAGRSVSVGWNASAISGEYLSAASFMGVAGMVMSSGYDALWYPVCYACGYLFLLLFIAGPLRRFGAYTIPDFAEGRYDSPLFRKIAVVFVLFIGCFYTMPQMKGAGTTLAYIFPGLPYWVGVVLVGAVITLNVALGGMKGITLVQAVQYWAKMFAISVPVFVLMSVYGGYGKQLGMNAQRSTSNIQLSTNATAGALDVGSSASSVRRSPLPAKAPKDETWLNPFGPLTTKAAKAVKPIASYSGKYFELGRSRMTSNNWVLLQWWFSMWTYGQQTGREPHRNDSALELIYECWDAHRLSDGLRIPQTFDYLPALVFSQPEWQHLTNVPSTVGMSHRQAAKVLDEALAKNGITFIREPGNVFKAFPTKDAVFTPVDPKPYALLYTYSLIIALVCGTAGLPHILVRFYTNPDGAAAKRTTMWVMILIGVFYVFPPVFGVMGRNLMPDLYNGAGVGGTDGLVLRLPTILHERFGVLGSVLSGITCAGAFAAFMSTFSGLLVSMTGALAHDVYGRILRPHSTATERMRMFKWCAVALGAVAVLLGTLVENFEINFMVGQAFAIAAASYFPLLFMSVWWRGMTTKGAATGMLAGGLSAMAAISLTSWTTFLTAQAAKFKALGVTEPGWFAALKPYSLTDFWAEHPLLRILGEQPALWAVPLAITLMVVVSKLTRASIPADIRMKMLVLHAPEQLGLKQEYIKEHEGAAH